MLPRPQRYIVEARVWVLYCFKVSTRTLTWHLRIVVLVRSTLIGLTLYKHLTEVRQGCVSRHFS